MRSPYVQFNASWQRFFAGAAIGAIVSWLLFLHMYSIMQEKQIATIRSQKQIIVDQKNKIDIWEKESQSQNKETIKKMKIHEIQVSITNYRELKLDLLSAMEAQEAIRKDLSSLLTKDVESVYKSKYLIKKTIENKQLILNEKTYSFEVAEVLFYSTLHIEVIIKRV
ncbi:sporulation membrane protein YtrI [Bacillus testis]|uniref:sporulation membrane protein YtrI n=1 Tax=Bacillus testis TaxID=1622072 RepID=UPI00067EF8A2|nr:sporulation membrane protein YtrI [Bacillus testis]